MTALGRVTFLGGCVVLLSLMVVACAAPGQPAHGANGSIDCAKLASLGVGNCPPADPNLFNPKLVNDTNGQVSNRDSKAYARGFLRAFAYEGFALDTNQAALLKAGILSTPHAIPLAFGADLQELSQAESEGGYLGGTHAGVASLRLVILSASVRQGILENGYKPTRLGWIVTIQGPNSSLIVAGSRFTILESASRLESADLLEWGQFQAHTPLGMIWQYAGGTQCTAAPLWQGFCESA